MPSLPDLPITPSPHPAANPPLWMGGTLGAIAGLVLVANAAHLEGWQFIAFVLGGLIVGLVAGLITQFHTTPPS